VNGSTTKHVSATIDDPFDLARFVQAQERQYPDALDELRSGRKQTHWIWFVFPQLRALGRSGTSRFYGLENALEASAYWDHPILGRRLQESVEALLAIEGRSATEILGSVDALKLRSCLTLFLEVAPTDRSLQAALQRFYGGEPDPLTLSHVRSGT
jgi:uncharacterized protein (DUF1810 family)